MGSAVECVVMLSESRCVSEDTLAAWAWQTMNIVQRTLHVVVPIERDSEVAVGVAGRGERISNAGFSSIRTSKILVRLFVTMIVVLPTRK